MIERCHLGWLPGFDGLVIDKTDSTDSIIVASDTVVRNICVHHDRLWTPIGTSLRVRHLTAFDAHRFDQMQIKRRATQTVRDKALRAQAAVALPQPAVPVYTREEGSGPPPSSVYFARSAW